MIREASWEDKGTVLVRPVGFMTSAEKRYFYIMGRQIWFIFTLILILSGCTSDGRKTFYLNIKHYAGATGLTLTYSIDEESIQVSTNCDLAGCKQKTVYKREFTKNKSDSIYNFIISLRLDTLKPKYQTKGMLDGLFTTVKFKKNFFTSRTNTFDNYPTPTTDILFRYIDNLILQKKYQYFNWGKD